MKKRRCELDAKPSFLEALSQRPATARIKGVLLVRRLLKLIRTGIQLQRSAEGDFGSSGVVSSMARLANEDAAPSRHRDAVTGALSIRRENCRDSLLSGLQQ
jgi:hypothetical protein